MARFRRTSLVVATAFSAAFAWSLNTAHAEPRAPFATSSTFTFYGAAIVTSATNCSFMQAGMEFFSVYHPRVAANPQHNFTGMAITTEATGQGFRLSNAVFTSAFKSVQSISYANGIEPLSGVQVRIVAQAPATLTPTSPYVQLRGEIKRPANDPGSGGVCIVGFDANYWRGPG